jgi:hypothetical protein
MRTWTFAAALLLAGCHERAPAPPDAAPQPPAAPAPAAPTPDAPAPVTTLAGEWRVAGIDGKPLDGPVGLALRGDAREIWWEPRCAGFVRSYRIAATSFSTGPYLGFKPRQPGEPTPPVCTIGLPPGLQDMFAALNAATEIRRTANNGIELSGGGRSLLLFSQ